MLCRYINRLNRFSVVYRRSLKNTTVASTDSNKQSAIKLCQEYGHRMKAYLARAESEQVLSLLDELI
jgi:hypothetical protein